MQFINLAQRDVLSILADAGGLLAGPTARGYLVVKSVELKRASESNRTEKNTRVKKKTERRKGHNLFGPWSRESEELEGSADDLEILQKAQTQAEVTEKKEGK